ncbi:uncharacterized protein [Triticum aestivum]|uniref:uncharacterized protein isoform X2 n=1 Tax=Triticum aestivum TaxID=4565 RepID=UPI001D00DDD9|nr:uncharacterized protein LOC123062126 isoform X2 [Triticum aestivum]
MIIMAYCAKNGAVSYVPAALRPADDVCYKRVLHSLRELSLLLNEQNVRCRLNASELRNKMQADMFSFADRLVSIVKEHCRCCARRGLKRCITLVEQGAASEGVPGMFKTPMRHVGRQLDLSDDDDGGRNYEPREKSPRGSIRIGCHGAQDSIGCVGMQEDGDANVIYNNSVAVQNVASVDNGIADRLTVYAQTVADMVRCMYCSCA